MDGPSGCDPAYCVVWFRFRTFQRYLALWPSEVGRVCRLLELVSEGSPGHGRVHLLAASASEVGFRWDPVSPGWSRPWLPCLVIWLVPFSISGLRFLTLGEVGLRLIFAIGSRGGPLLDVFGSLQLLNSVQVGERFQALLRSVMVGGVWNGFSFGQSQRPVCSLPVLWCS